MGAWFAFGRLRKLAARRTVASALDLTAKRSVRREAATVTERRPEAPAGRRRTTAARGPGPKGV